ncbi:WGR domain-containing protein [Streptomyces sp. NBC_00239]|uniref:WGR domain-containing protein n=1 Tax=Streptomyces sp. NBC_00239 TaxID=2903640 RepID=UPI002E27D3B0|nr:WGR domain-containing protein [Streptomyces sp. NBC_00239]
MASSDSVVSFGWELHFEDGRSDKFYRFIVVTGDEAIVLGLHGKRGDKGQIGLVHTQITAAEALRHAVQRSRDKEKKGYAQSRDFTLFDLPTDLSDPASASGNAHRIAQHFGKHAREAGTELDLASHIPGSNF